MWINIFQYGDILSGNFNLRVRQPMRCTVGIFCTESNVKKGSICQTAAIQLLLQPRFELLGWCLYKRKLSKHHENHLLSQQLQVQIVHLRVKSHPHPQEPATLFSNTSLSNTQNKYITRDPCQTSLPSLCDSSKGWRDVNVLQTRGKPSPTPWARRPAISAQPGGLGPVSPIHRAGLITGHTKEPASGAGSGDSPRSWALPPRVSARPRTRPVNK